MSESARGRLVDVDIGGGRIIGRGTIGGGRTPGGNVGGDVGDLEGRHGSFRLALALFALALVLASTLASHLTGRHLRADE